MYRAPCSSCRDTLPNPNRALTALPAFASLVPLLSRFVFLLSRICFVFLLSRICFCFGNSAMEAQDDCKCHQIPAFGDWNLWDDMPVTQYFQSGAFFFAAHGEKEDEDLFKVPQFPAKPYNYKKCVVRVKGEEASDVPVKKVGRRRYVKEQHKWKPKGAADEDLYKISPQLLYKVKKKKYLRNLLGGCLGLNCIA